MNEQQNDLQRVTSTSTLPLDSQHIRRRRESFHSYSFLASIGRSSSFVARVAVRAIEVTLVSRLASSAGSPPTVPGTTF